jgi:phosphatidylinositol alpha-1,6-mannosyltransferase
MINKWAAKVTARKADAVIATSTGMSTAWIQTGVSYDRINTIPLGIDTKRFHFVEGARKVLQLPDGSPILLYVGRYSREKGLYELMEAIGSLADMLRESKAQVILIGKGPLQAVLNSWVAENSLVDLVSVKGYVHQDQLKTWYSAANIMLMPSWNEPFGKVFLEAMACGTPTIATATEGPVDHITHGVNGFLIPIRDIDSLVAQIATALSSPALLEEMCDNCVNYVRSNLSWDAIVTKIVDRVYSPLA